MPVFSARLFFALCFLTAGSASAYELLGAAFEVDEGPVRYAVEPSGSADVTDGSDIQAIHNAFRSWSCIEGSRARFLEDDRDGIKVPDTGDGINTVFFDDEEAFTMLFGATTLAVTIGDGMGMPGAIGQRLGADIVFNGQVTWGTDGNGTDIESVAVHEAGHFVGLGHPCTDMAETDCLGPDESVMTPALPEGAVIVTPFADDENGVRELYPQAEDDPSTCDGPYRQGEPCACNDECIGDLLCSGQGADYAVCVPNCGSDPGACPTGYECVFGARADANEDAPGACVPVTLGDLPASARCERDSDCASNFCAASQDIGKIVCNQTCDNDDDCDGGYACTDGLCTIGNVSDGIACSEPEPEPEEPMCACIQSRDSSPALPLASLFVVGALLVRTRRRVSQKH